MSKHFLKVAAAIMVAAAFALCSVNAFAQNRAIRGKVVDQNGLAVIGASVSQKAPQLER